jgi:hypothetical protein
MNKNIIKLINFKIEHLENQMQDLHDSGSKHHSMFIELESKIYILKDLINDIQIFSNK